MKLYYSPGACSIAVHILLEEIGLPFEAERVSILEGQNLQQPFLALNERGQLPVLVEGGSNLRETGALLVYLSTRYPDAKLLPPAGSFEFGKAVEWLSWIASSAHVYLMQFWRPFRLAESEGAKEEIGQRARANFIECCRQIEAAVVGPWFLGDRFSAVDAYLLFCYRQGNRIGLDMAEQFPRFTAMAERIAERDAVARVMKREGVTLGGDRDSLPPQRPVQA